MPSCFGFFCYSSGEKRDSKTFHNFPKIYFTFAKPFWPQNNHYGAAMHSTVTVILNLPDPGMQEDPMHSSSFIGNRWKTRNKSGSEEEKHIFPFQAQGSVSQSPFPEVSESSHSPKNGCQGWGLMLDLM